MLDKRSRLIAAWRAAVTTPRLTVGWLGLLSGLASLRLVATLSSTWHGGLIILSGLTLAVWCWQLAQLATRFCATPLRFAVGPTLVGGLSWFILSLPLGLGGLSSRFWVRLTLPAEWINWVTLHRHGVLVVAGLGYGLLLWVSLINGPRRLRLTPAANRGTRLQMGQAFLINGGLTAGVALLSGGLVFLNRWADQRLTANLAQSLAAGSMVLIYGIIMVSFGLMMVTWVWCWCGQPLVITRSNGSKRGSLTRILLLGGIFVWGTGVVMQTMTVPRRFVATAVISHRGVDHLQGVQNTVEALRKVARRNPRYVEMDLHETKDHQWVVLHDENLRALAGRSQTPHQLTLRQLTGLRIRENGQTARLASWNQYLRVAEQLHQPLLVEIKTTPSDSAQAMAHFATRYGERLVRDGSAVHSLDYRVVRNLMTRVPKLRVGYITPFNWVSPHSVPADFYSLQRISVSDQFILAAHRTHAPAYIWTSDSVATMTRLWALGADGQITNEASRLQGVLATPRFTNWWAVVANFALSYG